MPITSSYFAVANKLNGTKISTARFHQPWIKKGVDEIMESFAPSEELLKNYKNKKVNWSQYKQKYLSEQRKHYKEKPENFENLLERAEEENIILLCYERFEGKKTKCHRMILYDLLQKVADKDKFEIDFFDEDFLKK